MKYYLPPEWVKQKAIMLTWPHKNSNLLISLEEVEETFLAIAKAITEYQVLIISCLDVDHLSHIKTTLLSEGVDLEKVRLYIVASNDIWARDHGPLTVIKEGKLHLLDFKFNGWGAKYPHALDDQVTKMLYEQKAFFDATIESIDYILEGGSVEVDGNGGLIVTESCLLADTRNPRPKKEVIEEQFKVWFGVDRVCWLKHGRVTGDDTDGHIDTLARFADANTIVYMTCSEDTNEDYAHLARMKLELETFRNAQGKPYRLVELPWVKKYSADGRRLPATYANFLIINGAVLLPVYDDPADEKAVEVMTSCFPDRKIIPIVCNNLIEQNGSLHCVTMQIPDKNPPAASPA